MRLTRLLPLAVLGLACAVLATAPVPVLRAAPLGSGSVINGVRDTGQFVPDTTWLVRVGPRVTTVGDFVQRYFESYGEDRPRADSLGRVQFMRSIVDKEVLGMSALAVAPKLGFEDRIQLRELEERSLANAVYQRYVADSTVVTDADVRDLEKQFTYDQHFRHIVFDNRGTAERVRRELLQGRMRWSDAVKRFSTGTAQDAGPDGDMGWVKRAAIDPIMGIRMFALKPGEISAVFQDREGFQLVQALERKTIAPISLEALRNSLRTQLRDFISSERSERIQQTLRDEIGLAYDSTNIAWASSRFKSAVVIDQSPHGSNINVDAAVPEFAPADTARTLAHWKNGGRISLSTVIHAYTELTPLVRPNLSFFDAMRGQVDAIVLEPFMAEYGRRKGLDKDPVVVSLLERKREQIAVEHLYQDSVASKTWVSKDERKAYYEKNKAQFVTYPAVDFAAIVRPSRKSADSLAAALKAGAKAAAILHADSLAGLTSGAIQHRRQDENGLYHKVLFEELRPGESSVFGPDKQGTFMVLQLLKFDSGRQLSFEESDAIADESLQNMKAEATLRSLIARMSKRYAIRTRPELLMRIKLVDPTLTQ